MCEMKLSQIRPCDHCCGAIVPIFFVVWTSFAVFNADATNEMLGLARMFQGSLALAEVMGSLPEAVKIGGEENKELWVEVYLCQNCYIGDVNLALLAEKIGKQNDESDGA